MNSSEIAAVVFFFLLSLGLLGWLALGFRRSQYSFAQTAPYFIGELITRFLWRTEVRGTLHLSPGQGAVLICNHRSSVDPFFLQLAAKRIVHWMVAREFFTVRFISWLLYMTEAISTRRGGVDTAAIRSTIRLAAMGRLVGILPEGRINMTDRFMLPVRPGAVMIALRAKVPIIPCYVEGSPYSGKAHSPFFMPAKVRITIGQPIDLSSYASRENEKGLIAQLTLQVVSEIATLAGQDNFTPKLAGRHWKPSAAEVEAAIEEKAQ